MSGRPQPPPLYAIADAGALGGAALGAGGMAAAVAEMAAAGVAWIQLRVKSGVADGELWRLAEACARALEGAGVALWADDRADVAASLPAAGVHLGQRDLPPGAARRVVGDGCWIGLSTHHPEQLAAADADPEVDVVALGPIFPTRGKENPDPVVGLAALGRARAATAKPLVAIGGIDESTIAGVLAAGADSAAVLGAVCRHRGAPAPPAVIGRNCRRLLAAAGVER